MLNCKKTTIKNKEWLWLHFVTLRCGILTLKTSDPFFRSFRFLGQNEAFSATEQNAIITILCSLEDLVQFSSISSAKAASASTAN